MHVSVEEYLEQYRATKGEDAWKDEVKRLAVQAIRTSPQHRIFWQELTKGYDWLDFDALVKEAEKQGEPENKDPEQIMAGLFQDQMPGIKSQAQYNAVVGALEAVRLVLNGILDQNPANEAEARKALEMAFDATRKATELTDKLGEVPEAATSPEAEDFKQPPAQYKEHEIYQQLMEELEVIKRLETLNSWYAETKKRRDRIVSQKLRDELLDSIRAKRSALLS